jgi:hypothetical protein
MNISNLEFCASTVKTQCEEEPLTFLSPPILLRHRLTQHGLTMSFTNAASGGDNNHRNSHHCQTFTGDLPLPATDTKCVQLLPAASYCQLTEHDQSKNRGDVIHL